jgi:hypothetical protein
VACCLKADYLSQRGRPLLSNSNKQSVKSRTHTLFVTLPPNTRQYYLHNYIELQICQPVEVKSTNDLTVKAQH